MYKLLGAPDPAPAIAAMSHSGVLNRLLPGVDTVALAPLIHQENQLGRPPHVLTRLAALGALEVRESLRLSSKDHAEYDQIRKGALGGTSPAELGFRFRRELAFEIIMLRAALSGQDVSQADVAALEHGAAQEFPVSAKDLMPTYTGAALGDRLKLLEAAWIASGFVLSKAELLAHE
jgi:poly(A) polymerase